MKLSVAMLAAAGLCFAATPAGATIHPGNFDLHEHENHSVLLTPHGKPGITVGMLPINLMHLNLGEFDQHDNGLHLGQLKHEKDKNKHHEGGPFGGLPGLHFPKGPKEGGGGGKGGEPIPEPSAAVLFVLGTGVVALRLRRPR